MVYKSFDKNSKGSGVANDEIKQNLQLAKELHKKEQFILDLKTTFGELI